MKDLLKQPILAICNIAGHNWRYQDYSNWMKENGEPYDFSASRTCFRCKQRAYFYKEWVESNEKLTQYDVKSKSEYLKNLPFMRHFE